MLRISDNDSDMLLSFRRGEEEGFNRVFEKYYPALSYYASRFSKDRQWIEDILQEVFLNLWNKRDKFGEIGSIQAYLYRSVTNHCISRLQQEKRVKTKLDEFNWPQYDDSTMYDQIVRSELYSNIYKLIEELPPRFSEIIRLYYLEQKGIHEIAKILGIPVYTVKSRRQRAVLKLREMLPGYFRSILALLSSFVFF